MALPSIRRLASLKGRSDRREFALWLVLVVGGEAALFTLMDRTSREGLSLVLGMSVLMALSVIGVAAVVRRMHDVNLSAWIGYLFALGIKLSQAFMRWQGGEVRSDLLLVGLAVGLAGLAIVPGTAGENRFGQPPRWAGPSSG
jgi:uncharacterized membrane protein YhaH (DUF805 family)